MPNINDDILETVRRIEAKVDALEPDVPDPGPGPDPTPDPDPVPPPPDPEPNDPTHQWWSQWFGPFKPTHPRLQPMPMVFARWPGIPPVNSTQLWPDNEKDRTAAEIPAGTTHAVIDIEHTYPLAAYLGATPESQVVLVDALEGMKARRPDVKWSIYGLPLREYFGAIDPTSSGAAIWHERNENSRDAMAACDFLTPSIYRFYAQDQYNVYAQAMVSEARKFAGTEKEVLPFIWPVFHPAGNPARALMTGPQWRTVLDAVVPISDGVVLWGDSIGPLAGGPWWDVTTAYMAAS